jgi:hypothetical protein
MSGLPLCGAGPCHLFLRIYHLSCHPYLAEGGWHVEAVIENVCATVLLVVISFNEMFRSPLPEAL